MLLLNLKLVCLWSPCLVIHRLLLVMVSFHRHLHHPTQTQKLFSSTLKPSDLRSDRPRMVQRAQLSLLLVLYLPKRLFHYVLNSYHFISIVGIFKVTCVSTDVNYFKFVSMLINVFD